MAKTRPGDCGPGKRTTRRGTGERYRGEVTMSTLNPAEHLVTPPGHDAGHVHAAHHEIGFVKKYIFSTDHKIIGIQFLITTLLMLLVGGSLALGVRWQLAFRWSTMPIVG